jgi:hypothetical protein
MKNLFEGSVKDLPGRYLGREKRGEKKDCFQCGNHLKNSQGHILIPEGIKIQFGLSIWS